MVQSTGGASATRSWQRAMALGSAPAWVTAGIWSPMRCRLTGGMALSPSRQESVERCEKRLDQPLEGLARALAPGVAGHHVPVAPPPLVLDRSVRRSCRHHAPGHADAAAVAGETVA